MYMTCVCVYAFYVDGHIAFNEPGSSLASKTRVKTLAYSTVVANARFFGKFSIFVPHRNYSVLAADSKPLLVETRAFFTKRNTTEQAYLVAALLLTIWIMSLRRRL